MAFDWTLVWERATAHFILEAVSIHGPDHWQRVEQQGLILANQNGGDLLVVRLFAVFHDVCRRNDGSDDGHGARGAELAVAWRDHLFSISDTQFALLHFACTHHTTSLHSDDPTIGACWDADRLDIWRAGIHPHERYMSTEHARYLVRTGQTGMHSTPR